MELDVLHAPRHSGESSTPRLGSSLASVPSAATHFGPAGGSVGALTGRNASAASGGVRAAATTDAGTGAMHAQR